MAHNLRLPPFKEICKSSWIFYKANWKTIVLLFIPVEVAALLCFVALDLIPETDFFMATIGIVVLSTLAVIFSLLSKIITLDAPYLMERIAFGEKIPKVGHWYWSLIKRIIPISLVLFLVGFLNFGFISLVTIVACAIFFLISLLINLLASHETLAIILNIALVVSLLYAVFKYLIAFFVRGMFSIYVYLFEKRPGLDALTHSFLITEGREFGIFWRSLFIWFITSIPFLILVMPINATILYRSFSDLYVQMVVLHQEPVIASPSTFVVVLLDIMTSISGVIGVSLFVVLNYFLWRDVKATAVSFEEDKYTKTRKYLKSLIGFGVVFFVAMIATALISGAVLSE